MTDAFSKTLQHGESKVSLAVETYDMVDRHIRRLDEDLMRFEDELMMTGPRLTNVSTGNLNQSSLAVSHDLSLMQKRSEEERKSVEHPAIKKRKLAPVVTSNPANGQSRASSAAPTIPQAVTATENTDQVSSSGALAPITRERRRRDSSASNNASVTAAKIAVSTVPDVAIPSAPSASIVTPGSTEKKISAPRRMPRGNVSGPPEPRSQESLEGMPVDPNEPTYCTCSQVSYGAMIACDNEDCSIEWFHYDCVGLEAPPKGKWYCEDCRAQFGMKK